MAAVVEWASQAIQTVNSITFDIVFIEREERAINPTFTVWNSNMNAFIETTELIRRIFVDWKMSAPRYIRNRSGPIYRYTDLECYFRAIHEISLGSIPAASL